MLFEQYAARMMTLCRRYARDQQEAEDMLQEGWIRVFGYIHAYRFEGSLEGWIKRVMVNAALRVIQTRKISWIEVSEAHEEVLSADPDVLSGLSANELLKLICGLPDGYRIVFNLHAMEGYDHQEIGRILGIKPATSRSQLAKARDMLKEQIKNLVKLPERYDR
jgi:RNA polymerase sigma factor (sigma-70 family)